MIVYMSRYNGGQVLTWPEIDFLQNEQSTSTNSLQTPNMSWLVSDFSYGGPGLFIQQAYMAYKSRLNIIAEVY